MISQRRCFVVSALFIAGSLTGLAQYLTPEGKISVPSRRIDSWVWSGGDREVLELTIARIQNLDGSGPGSWPYEFGKVAAHYDGRGDELSKQGRAAAAYARRPLEDKAFEAYLKASLYFAIGYFPDNRTPDQRASYKRHVESFLKAGQYFKPPMEVVKVPYRNAHIVVHLHRPEGVASPPLVLWTGGVDWWKGSIYQEIRTAVGRGMAVAAFDLAGTGEMDQFQATPEGDDVHRTVLEYFAGHGFDRSRMAYVGTSFGGFYAVKLAASDLGLRAAVNICGGTAIDPLSLADAAKGIRQRLAGPEGGTMRAVFQAVGVDLSEPDKLAAKMAGFNLQAAGIVVKGKSKSIKTPLLNINGTRDPSFPWEGYLNIVNSSDKPDLWLLGSSGHCARDYFGVVAPQLADWLIERLK